MDTILALLTLFILLGTIFFAQVYFSPKKYKSRAKRYKKKETFMPSKGVYGIRGPVITQTESTFFNLLQQTVQNRWHIATKVRVADILSVNYAEGSAEWKKWFRLIGQKHADFVLFDKMTNNPLLIIELNDKSHNLLVRQERDRFLDRAYKSAHIPVLWQHAQYSYDTEKLLHTIESLIRVPAK